MKAEWLKYLELIGITDLFLKRIEAVVNFYQQLYANQIEDIFVAEHVDSEGNRQYESLWLFSQYGIGEAKQFLRADDFDFVPLSVQYWCIKKTEYDFQKANSKSRMTLDLTLAFGTTCRFKASRENCDYLRDCFTKHIVASTMK